MPSAASDYYGFPGTDRMIWEFRMKPEDLHPYEGDGSIDLSFYARDEDGQEALLGTRSIRYNGQKNTGK